MRLIELIFSDEDLEKLENMQNSLSNYEEISSELSFSSQIISEDNIGLISNLLKLKNSIDKVSKNSEKFKSISQRLDAIKIEIEDIVHEIDYFLDSFEQSPENLNRVIDKIDLINNLLRKHSCIQLMSCLYSEIILQKRLILLRILTMKFRKLKQIVMN